MVMLGSRQDEVFYRSTHRSVTCIVSMFMPAANGGKKPGVGSLGLIFDGGKPVAPLTEDISNSQHSYLLQHHDTCSPRVSRSPALLSEILDDLGRRTKNVDPRLTVEEKRVVFDSVDLMNKAAGIPLRLRYDFAEKAGDALTEAARIPFARLQDTVEKLHHALEEIGGSIHSLDVVHQPSMDAFEYYEISTQKYHPGRKFSYGDIMLAKANNLLGRMGVPLVVPPRPQRH